MSKAIDKLRTAVVIAMCLLAEWGGPRHVLAEIPPLSLQTGPTGGCSNQFCPGVPQYAGDANGDGLVDPFDFSFVLFRLGADMNVLENRYADVNCDGAVDPLDGSYVLARFGEFDPVCRPTYDTIEEPMVISWCPGAATLDTSTATGSESDPALPCLSDDDEISCSPTVWASFVAEGDSASIHVEDTDFEPVNATFPLAVAVYECVGGSLTEALACIETPVKAIEPLFTIYCPAEVCVGDLKEGATYFIQIVSLPRCGIAGDEWCVGEIKIDVECPCPSGFSFCP